MNKVTFPDPFTAAICQDLGADAFFLRHEWMPARDVEAAVRAHLKDCEEMLAPDQAPVTNRAVDLMLEAADLDFVRVYLDAALGEIEEDEREGQREHTAVIEHQRIESAPGRFI